MFRESGNAIPSRLCYDWHDHCYRINWHELPLTIEEMDVKLTVSIIVHIIF